MSITPKERKEIYQELKDYHKDMFKSLRLNEDHYDFIPKMAHYSSGLDGLHLGFFFSEISSGRDIYIELTSKDFKPSDPNRTLWKLKSNEFFDEEYHKIDGTPVRYMVSIEELEEVRKPLIEKIKVKTEPRKSISTYEKPVFVGDIELSEDCNFKDMTLRDYAAIQLQKPVSSKNWLNKIIET